MNKPPSEYLSNPNNGIRRAPTTSDRNISNQQTQQSASRLQPLKSHHFQQNNEIQQISPQNNNPTTLQNSWTSSNIAVSHHRSNNIQRYSTESLPRNNDSYNNSYNNPPLQVSNDQNSVPSSLISRSSSNQLISNRSNQLPSPPQLTNNGINTATSSSHWVTSPSSQNEVHTSSVNNSVYSNPQSQHSKSSYPQYNSAPPPPQQQYNSMPPPPQQQYVAPPPLPSNKNNNKTYNNAPNLSNRSISGFTQPSTIDSSQYSSHSADSPNSPVYNSFDKNAPRRSNSRIDPSQMPRPPRPQTDITFHTRSGTGRKVPPLVNSGYMAIDAGNSLPRHIRITMCAPPISKDVLNQVGIPYAAMATPFAAVENGEKEIAVVDMGESPPRCSRCQCYINPSVSWLDKGNSWGCNLCGMINPVPTWYYSSLDGSDQRLDKSSRIELSRGSVDFKVDKNYCVRSLQEPLFVFAIDISKKAISSGATMAAILAIQNNIVNLPGGSKTRVGIITYNDQIQYYYVREDAPEPITIIISDADDPVVPIPLSKWVLSTTTHISSIELLLNRIPELINSLQSRVPVMSNFDETRSCPTSALKSIQEALEISGGRVFIISSNHPSTGYGKCRVREQISTYGQDSEFSLYGSTASVIETSKSAEDKKALSIYKELEGLCLKCNICVDFFICYENDDFRGAALFGDICRFTGGNLHYFQGSMILDDNIHRLDSELKNALCNFCGSEAIMKLRTSVGVRVDQIIGKGVFSEINGEVELAGLDQFSTFCFTLRNDATLKDEDKVHLQLAVLYTTCNMERMVRVHNLSLVASSNPTSIFRYTDLDTVTCTLAKLAADKALLNPLSNDPIGPRSFLNKSVADILLKYRMNCSSQSPKGQLILPESLKVLPLFILGMLKHPAFIENTTGIDNSPRSAKSIAKLTVRADERAYELRRLLSLPIKNTINCLYPRMFALHLFEDDLSGAIDFSGDMGSQLPRSLIVSSEVFESDGVYLLDEGSTLYLYIGRNVSQSRIEDWFSVAAHNRPSHIKFRHSSDVACKMSEVVDILRSESINKQELKCIWQDEPTNLESNRFSLRIIEDSIYGAMSYVDYLCRLHSSIQNK